MERKPSPLSKFFDAVDLLENILCGGTLICLLFVVLLQVACRPLHLKVTWTEETTRFFFLWMMFMAVAAGFNRAESSRVVILVNLFPRPLQKLCNMITAEGQSSLLPLLFCTVEYNKKLCHCKQRKSHRDSLCAAVWTRYHLEGNKPSLITEEAVQTLQQLWDAGFAVAAHQLGKCWRDGLGVLPDDGKAELWFRHPDEAGNDFSQYALSKLLQSRKRITKAVEWYEQAAVQGNQYANYRPGKLYLQGEGVPKDEVEVASYLSQAAKAGTQYAQHALGKLYLDRQEEEQAHYWFTQSAAQGNEYAQFFLDRWDRLKQPSVLLSATRLLHHMSEIFQDNSVPPQAPAGQQVDRKLRLKIREEKLAIGHKADDHEEYSRPLMSM